MSELQNEFDGGNKVSSTKKITEEKTTSVISDNEEIDDSLIIENDGDFFWILHRIAWGTIKGLLLIGLIFITIWFIWKDDNNIAKIEIKNIFPKEEIKNNRDIEDKQSKKYISGNNISSNTDVKTYLDIINKAYKINENRIKNTSGILSASILWLGKAKSLGEISMTILRIEEPKIRAQKIESILLEADEALKQSAYLQKVLNTQIQDLLYKKNKLENNRVKLENEIFENISKFNPNNINEILEEKIINSKEIAEISEKGQIRELLLKNIKNFDYLLRKKWIPLVRPTEMKGVNQK